MIPAVLPPFWRKDGRMPSNLLHIRHVVLDMDGTLYYGSRLFGCTLPFLDRLRDLGIGFTFVTNNNSRSKAEYVEKLRRLGMGASEGDIYTSTDSTIDYLRATLPQVHRLAVLGTPSLCGDFQQAGFEVDWEAPEAVVIGFDTSLSYERLCRAAFLIASGLPFIATHPDWVCPTDQPTVLVDCGSICACLTAATGGRRPVVLGKPDPLILHGVCHRHGLRADEVAMVGDRLYTDMAMAHKAGVLGILALSGEATAAEAAALEHPADLVVRDVGELGELFLRAHAQKPHHG
jgi:NagD protein